MAEHPNKHIREAIKYALEKGWRLLKAGPRAHVLGTIILSVRTTRRLHHPGVFNAKKPENHARRIREEVDNCPHV